MATILLRDAKGAPLTHDEVDANFTNLNDDKIDVKGGTLEDNAVLGIGADSDLSVFHDETNTYVRNVTGELFIQSDNITLCSWDSSRPTFMSMDENGAVDLFFNNKKRLETTTDGVTVYGTLVTDAISLTGGNAIVSDGPIEAAGITVTGGVTADGTSNMGNIQSAGYVSAVGNIITQGEFATEGGLTSDGDVIVNANATVSGTVTASFFAGGDITCNTLTSAGAIAAGGDVSVAGGFTAGDVTANGSIVGGAITSSGTISSTGGITSGGDVIVTGALSVTDAETTRRNLNVDQAGEALAFAIALG